MLLNSKYFHQELDLLNSVGAHIFTNTLRQLLATSTELRHLRFQFVDTLNDEVGKSEQRGRFNAWHQVCAELLRSNPLKQLRTLTFDQVPFQIHQSLSVPCLSVLICLHFQCHSVSLHSLLLFLEADNCLSELQCWSCRWLHLLVKSQAFCAGSSQKTTMILCETRFLKTITTSTSAGNLKPHTSMLDPQRTMQQLFK